MSVCSDLNNREDQGGIDQEMKGFNATTSGQNGKYCCESMDLAY